MYQQARHGPGKASNGSDTHARSCFCGASCLCSDTASGYQLTALPTPGRMQWPPLVLTMLVYLACHCSRVLGQQVLASGRVAGQYDPVTGLAFLPLVLSWPSTTIWAAFDSSDSIEVSFVLPPGYSLHVNISLAFDLDGQIELVYVDEFPYTWSKSGLSEGLHALEIIKRSETLYGVLMLSGMNVSSSGRSVIQTLLCSVISNKAATLVQPFKCSAVTFLVFAQTCASCQ